MNIQEVAVLLATIVSVDKRGTDGIDDATWQGILEDVELQDALDAVKDYYRAETRWIMPADVRRIVKAARKARLDAAGPPDLPSGLDQVREREYARAWRQAIAHGMSRDDATSHVDGLGGIVRPELAPADPARMRALAAGAFR